jgi:hypothetical protein
LVRHADLDVEGSNNADPAAVARRCAAQNR